MLHDERLSDLWALGVRGYFFFIYPWLTKVQVTMYEIVVGRTPFEKTEAEEFLTRDALEIYCTFVRPSPPSQLAHRCPQTIERRWEPSVATSPSPQVSLFVISSVSAC